jgi:hypothetical protein
MREGVIPSLLYDKEDFFMAYEDIKKQYLQFRGSGKAPKELIKNPKFKAQSTKLKTAITNANPPQQSSGNGTVGATALSSSNSNIVSVDPKKAKLQLGEVMQPTSVQATSMSPQSNKMQQAMQKKFHEMKETYNQNKPSDYDYTFYGNATDIENAKRGGYGDRVNYVDLSSMSEVEKFQHIMNNYNANMKSAIIGGTKAQGGISEEMQRRLLGKGISLDRISGADRQETVLAIKDYMKDYLTEQEQKRLNAEEEQKLAEKRMAEEQEMENMKGEEEAQQEESQADIDARMKAIEEFLKGSSDSFYENQEAMLDNQREQQITDLLKAYEDAIAQGEMSIDEAEEQLQANMSQINENAFNQEQLSRNMAQEMGIQNSQQSMGMRASDNQRTNEFKQDATSERDSRINTLKDRIANITKQKDLDVAQAKNDYSTGLRQAQAQADQMFNENMTNLKMEDLSAFRQNEYDISKMNTQQRMQMEQMAKAFGYDLEKMSQQQIYAMEQFAKQHDYDLEKMNLGQEFDLDKMKQQDEYNKENIDKQHEQDKEKMEIGKQYDLEKMKQQNAYELGQMNQQQKYQLEQMAKAYGYDLSKMGTQQQYTLIQMAKQNGYDLNKMQQAHGYDLEKMSEQYSYDSSLQDQSYENQSNLSAQEFSQRLKTMSEQAKIDRESELQAYDLAVERELAKYTPGTSEYKIREEQLNQERESLISEIHASTSYDAMAKSILNGQTTKPEKPKKSWWESKSKHAEDMAEYEQKLSSYNRYLEYQKSAESQFPW